ncbi:MAG: hydroxymethylbilane synthase [Planctomycetes bacterium]|nr:hydroxymethylbilane synthase [Planctomycetota bacterium]
MIRIATRGSALALAQSRAMAASLEASGEAAVLIVRKTTGDVIVDRPFTSIEGKGIFTKELEDALLQGDADVAVHSLKDLPVDLPAGLSLAATPPREDPADILIIRKESYDPRFALPVAQNAHIGTSSTRRRSQWIARRPDTSLMELRGNITTRIERLHSGLYDAILLAKAGINRLGVDLSEFTVVRLDPSVFVPAPGQAALGLEIRADDAKIERKLAFLNDANARAAVDAERAVLASLGGGCSEPVGAYARRRGRCAVIDAVLGPVEPGSAPMRRARAVAETFTQAAKRAAEILKSAESEIPFSLKDKTVILTQQKGRGDALARELEERGARTMLAPMIETRTCADDLAIRQIERCAEFDYILFTSRTASDAFLGAGGFEYIRTRPRKGGPVFGAVGRGSAEPLECAGAPVDIVSKGDGALALAELVKRHAATRSKTGPPRVLFPCAREPRAELEQSLGASGFTLVRATLYETTPAAAESLQSFVGEKADFTIFFSPSGVATFKALRPFETKCAVAIGAATLAALRGAKFPNILLSPGPEPASILSTIQ